MQHVLAVPMCFGSVDTSFNGLLEAFHAHNDDNWYDRMNALLLNLILTSLGHIRMNIIATTSAARLGSFNVLRFFRHNV